MEYEVVTLSHVWACAVAIDTSPLKHISNTHSHCALSCMIGKGSLHVIPGDR